MNIAVIAFLIDAIIGDPLGKYHPVALIGRMIAGWERLLYRAADSDTQKLAKGLIMVILTLGISFGLAELIMWGSYYLPGQGEWRTDIIGGLLLSFTISPKSLARAGRGIYALLLQDKMDEARHAVGMIVGRDTEKLDASEVSRATIETIAENTVDGILSPLFFFVIGGVPLAVLYRAANTLDSMVGYKNDKYLYFGRAAARLDDVLNYIPARITGVLFILSAWLLGFDYKHARDIMRRDAARHPSPNGGYAEATVAGALHIRLGGYNSYFGRMTFRAYMGDAIEKIAPHHIMECIRMMYTATVLFLIITYAMFGL